MDYKKVKDLDKNKSLWQIGDHHFVISWAFTGEETGVFVADKSGKVESYTEVWMEPGKTPHEKLAYYVARNYSTLMNMWKR